MRPKYYKSKEYYEDLAKLRELLFKYEETGDLKLLREINDLNEISIDLIKNDILQRED